MVSAGAVLTAARLFRMSARKSVVGASGNTSTDGRIDGGAGGVHRHGGGVSRNPRSLKIDGVGSTRARTPPGREKGVTI